MHKRLIFMLLCALSGAAQAAPPNFAVDEQLQKNARIWAKEFIEFAAVKYQVTLDWSLVSIKFLDEIADDLHRTYVEETPPEEEIVPVARALGSYVAEVYRIHNGGSWGWVDLETGSFPAIQSRNGATFLPLAKALDRIKTGDDPDIWEYYQLLHKP